MIKFFIPIFLLTLMQFNLSGQSVNDTLSQSVRKHSLGFGAGFSTGYGLSYRFIPKKFGFQINFAPFTSKDQAVYSAGLTFLYKLIQGKNTNLLLYQGNHYYYRHHDYEFWNSGSETTKSWINGIGFGIEFLLDNVGFNIMSGFASYSNSGGVNLTGEVGLYYKF